MKQTTYLKFQRNLSSELARTPYIWEKEKKTRLRTIIITKRKTDKIFKYANRKTTNLPDDHLFERTHALLIKQIEEPTANKKNSTIKEQDWKIITPCLVSKRSLNP